MGIAEDDAPATHRLLRAHEILRQCRRQSGAAVDTQSGDTAIGEYVQSQVGEGTIARSQLELVLTSVRTATVQ